MVPQGLSNCLWAAAKIPGRPFGKFFCIFPFVWVQEDLNRNLGLGLGYLA